jgi:hypothetical protein
MDILLDRAVLDRMAGSFLFTVYTFILFLISLHFAFAGLFKEFFALI